MAYLRRLYRIVAIIFWTVFTCAISIPYRFSGWDGSKKIAQLVQLWARGMASIVGLRVKVIGDIPDVRAGLVVSNHLGYMDIIAHGTLFPPRFTSSKEIDGWPVIGRVVAMSRPVIVDRKSKPASKKASRDFAKTMKRKMYLVVYPEGTSSDGRSGILPFKSTPFEAAISGNIPVLPLLTRYQEEPGDPTVCWYGDMTFLPHIWQVLLLDSIKAEVRFLEPIFADGRSRKELASFVHGVMAREYSYALDRPQ